MVALRQTHAEARAAAQYWAGQYMQSKDGRAAYFSLRVSLQYMPPPVSPFAERLLQDFAAWEHYQKWLLDAFREQKLRDTIEARGFDPDDNMREFLTAMNEERQRRAAVEKKKLQLEKEKRKTDDRHLETILGLTKKDSRHFIEQLSLLPLCPAVGEWLKMGIRKFFKPRNRRHLETILGLIKMGRSVDSKIVQLKIDEDIARGVGWSGRGKSRKTRRAVARFAIVVKWKRRLAEKGGY